MSTPATIPNRRLADLIHASHRGDQKATEKLRAWASAHPDEAQHAAKRSWKFATFLREQGLSP